MGRRVPDNLSTDSARALYAAFPACEARRLLEGFCPQARRQAQYVARSNIWVLCGPDRQACASACDCIGATISSHLSAFSTTLDFTRRRH
jgi:hypothetical protein